jgi:hypothetical protein
MASRQLPTRRRGIIVPRPERTACGMGWKNSGMDFAGGQDVIAESLAEALTKWTFCPN